MKRIIFSLISKVFELLDKLYPTKSFIVFGCRAGKDYADNSKVLFEKFLAEGYENAFFFTRNKKVLGQIPANGVYAYSLKGLNILLRSRVLVFTHGSGDFAPFFPCKNQNRVFINLFHAIAVKEVGHNNDRRKLKEKKKWDYFIVSSKFEADTVMRQFSLSEKQILVLGQPRNDVLIQGLKSERSDDREFTVMYAPTFRGGARTELFPFEDKDLTALDEYLVANNIRILIRLHLNEENSNRDLGTFNDPQNIELMSSKAFPSVNEELHRIDALITDYSSIALDFLLLDRPIAYVIYDFDKYQKERGFAFDFKEHMAGPSITTQKGLVEFLSSESDLYMEKRESLKKLFHKFDDGKSTERIYEFINKL